MSGILSCLRPVADQAPQLPGHFIMRPMFLNLATYRFVDLDELAALREHLLSLGIAHQLKGTILLASEGINAFLCCSREQFDAFRQDLERDERFAGLDWKESVSAGQAFRKWKVKIKSEIITFRKDGIRPADHRAETVSPATLKRWLDAGHDDEGLPVRMMDTRNDYEVAAGTFVNAIDPDISKFSELPSWLARQPESFKRERIVSFCTGGIRCEKSALYMAAEGYDKITQLEGGILRYFEHVGQAHWQGHLYVFDGRRGVDPALQPVSDQPDALAGTAS